MAKSAAAKSAAPKRNVIPLRRRRSPISTGEIIDRSLALEIVRVTERAAVAAARLRGRGDERAADQAAVDAMRRELDRLPIHGEIVIGEGDRDSAAMLFIGEEVGDLNGPRLDIALDPLEGVTLCAKGQANAISVIAIAERGTLLKAPDVYMSKIAIGPDYAPDTVHLDAAPEDNIRRLAAAKGVSVQEITACILDRPRHARLIDAVRGAGASIRLISDGDISAVIDVANPDKTGVDIYLGSGGAPEGVLAAAALKCIGGHMQARLMLDTADARRAAAALGIRDADRIYGIEDMARGDVLFAATGVTEGSLLQGVRFGPRSISTETVVMRSSTLTCRRIFAEHRKTEKFHLD
ncbi:class II fructose-bisphosphatase [Methylopila sp. M107]|uniref:class II fructose-bisphosphatase n=1 Tax=Methylopila sp. M107 TaxID=1101190 RepID=UPI00036224E1|nr:class II fructose-bisphosphatase [Methylopila sp. M107]